MDKVWRIYYGFVLMLIYIEVRGDTIRDTHYILRSKDPVDIGDLSTIIFVSILFFAFAIFSLLDALRKPERDDPAGPS